MSKEKQFHIEPGVISKLPWVKGHIPYLYHTTNGLFTFGTLYEIDKSKEEKLKTLFRGTELTLKKDDKVYVLPMHPTPLFKIKNYCKQVGCTLTTDLTEATVILGHENILNSGYAHNQILYSDSYENLSALPLEYLDLSNLKDIPVFKESFTELYNYESLDFVYASYETASYLAGWRSKNPYKDDKRNTDLWSKRESKYSKLLYAQPYTVNLIYNILLRKLPIVSFQSLNSQFKKDTVIDKELYDSLYKMFKGSTDDQKVAVNILTNCDIKKSIFYIIELASDWRVRNVIYENSSYKHVREFTELSDWNNISGLSLNAKFELLVKHGQMSTEHFKYFYDTAKEKIKDDTRSKLEQNFLSEMFKVEISLNEEYLEKLKIYDDRAEEKETFYKDKKYKHNETNKSLMDILNELTYEPVTTT